MTPVSGHNSEDSCLLYVTDKRTGTQFLVDNEVKGNVVPTTKLEKNHLTSY